MKKSISMENFVSSVGKLLAPYDKGGDQKNMVEEVKLLLRELDEEYHLSNESTDILNEIDLQQRPVFASERSFGKGMQQLGIGVKTIFRNSPVSVLYEQALRNEVGSAISSTGALMVSSGTKTGRSPSDKRIVKESSTEQDIWWGAVNIPLDERSFMINRERAIDYLNTRSQLYVVDGYAGHDPRYRIKCRIICSRAYHALFMQNMLVRPTREQLQKFNEPDYVIYNAGEFPANMYTQGMTSNTSVSLNFARREMVILGTQYAGEMKKGVFTIMNYLMPKAGLLPMHASCNEGPAGDTSIFFGLSGTGKCWGKGTGILQYDGRIRPVEDLKFGDLLMGDDGTPRRIISEPIHGKGQMYRITPSPQAPGRPFSCNDDHILVLRLSKPRIWDSVCGDRRRARVQYMQSHVDNDGDVIVMLKDLSREYGPNGTYKNYKEAKAALEIALNDLSQQDNFVNPDTYIWEVRAEAFFEKASPGVKNRAMMYMPGAISFPAREGFLRRTLQEVLGATPTDDQVRAAAYVLGSWLGDGCSASPRIYVAASEKEQLKALHHAIKQLGCDITVSDSKGDGTLLALYIKAIRGNGHNPFLDLLRSLNVYENKHIPEELALDELVNVRYHLLAGLLDTDGSFDPVESTYDFVQKRKQITDMVHRMANNSGFRCNNVARAMKIATNGKAKEEYWRCLITGPDMSMLPISIPRKRDPGPSGRATKPNKRHLHWGFTITKLDRSEEEDYYGFTVDGNSRLLLADNTVTHNTTLSADPHRKLIGDDEHVWTDTGVFNIEGGCYAKCVNLREENEPEIFRAIRFGAVLENVVYDGPTRDVDYDDISITENTRCAYPLEYIPNCKIPAVTTHPTNIIMLTCDAFGVLPPVSRLSPEQAMYHFISGYTAKVAGTEEGVTEPQATFSACFGAPFMVWHPSKYAELLAEKMKTHNTNAWLVNTGWVGGSAKDTKRIPLRYTRAIIDAIHSGELAKQSFEKMPIFGMEVPLECPGVPSELLKPRSSWKDKDVYDATAKDLAKRFQKNFEQFRDQCSDSIVNAGPKLD